MAKKESPLTPEILIATLKRSNLKTVLIEGKDDLLIYKKIESELEDLDINILPCNGRTALLEVFKNKSDIDSELLFICDADLWVFDNKAPISDDLIVTEGYSIENELYQDGSTILNKLLSANEIISKNLMLSNICEWFAYEVEKYLNCQTCDCKFSEVTILNTNVMARNSNNFTDNFINERMNSKASDNLIDDIKANYDVKLRGKYLFQIYEKLFQQRSKQAVKYRRDQLFDLIYNIVSSDNEPNKNINNRIKQISEFFNE